MKSIFDRFFIVIFLCFFYLNSHAQSNIVDSRKHTVFVKGMPSKNGQILLRVLINPDVNPENVNKGNSLVNLWNNFINNGYQVERRLKVGDQVLPEVQKKFLLKPSIDKINQAYPLVNEKEKEVLTAIKNALFKSKQEIFGEKTTLSSTAEISQRRFALLMASMTSFKASVYADLAIIDGDVLPDATYEYTVRSLNPPDEEFLYEEKFVIKNNYHVVPSNDPNERRGVKSKRTAAGQSIAEDLTEPPKMKGKFGNKRVTLTWNWKKEGAKNSHQDLYFGYFIERATAPNLTDFVPVNSIPYISSDSKNPSMSFEDRDTAKANLILRNGTKYAYKIIGVTYFDELIPSTHIVEGICEDDEYYIPQIVKDTMYAQTNTIKLDWRLPPEAPDNRFDKFYIGRALELQDKMTYEKIVLENGSAFVSGLSRSAIFKNITEDVNTTKTAYYTVIGVTRSGEEMYSWPKLIQSVDTLPPVEPQNVVAIWNESDKTVKLSWSPNTEKDLLGYQVFRCLPGALPTVITRGERLNVPNYQDTIEIENLKMEYYVIAVDNLFNPSKFSKVCLLERPDMHPPVKAFFRNYVINHDGSIMLNFTPSSSDDIAKYQLTKSIGSGSTSLKTWAISDVPSSYLDNNITQSGKIDYILEVSDKAGNKSTDLLSVFIPSTLIPKPQFTVLNSTATHIDANVKLTWEYQATNADAVVKEFKILKSDVSLDPAANLHTFKVLPPEMRDYTDYNVSFQHQYKYAVKAIFEDGSSSNWLYTSLTMPTSCGGERYLELNTILSNTTNVLKEACDEIILQPGFEANRGVNFEAKIKIR